MPDERGLMTKKLWGLFIIIGFLLNTGILSASGLSLFEVGSRAASMSGAFVGLADNTSAIYYNPAGIAFQKGVGFQINMTYSKYKATAESNAEQDSASYDSVNEHLLGSFFVSWNLHGKFSIGLGGFSPYTMGTHWPINWPGEQLNSITKVATFYLRPTVAWKVTDGLAIGAGLDIVWASQRWESELYYRYNIMHSNGTGIGFSGGILLRLSDHFHLGGRYQHRVKVDQKGTFKAQSSPLIGASTSLGGEFSTHTYSATALGPSLSGTKMSPQDTMDVQEFYDIISSQTLPSEAVFGLAWSPLKKLRILADAKWTEWSTFEKIEFESEDQDDDSIQTVNFSWKDTWSYMFGIEYFINEILSIKGGYAHHQSPSPDETLSPIFPVLPHNVLSFGLGYNGPVRSITDQSLLGKLNFDVFIQYVMSDDTTSTLKDLPLNYFGNVFIQDFPLTYSGNNFILGFGVGLNF
jgi:long-chain fatty acid transport protein